MGAYVYILIPVLLIALYFWLSSYFSYSNREWRKKRKSDEKERLKRETEWNRQHQERIARSRRLVCLASSIGWVTHEMKWNRELVPERDSMIEEYLSVMRIDNPEATLDDALKQLDDYNSVVVMS